MTVFLIYDTISSGMKASLFSSEGKLLAEARRSLPQRLSGRIAEQPWESWETAMEETTREVFRLAGPGAGETAAIALSGMSQVCLCLGKDGRPLAPAMTWSDSRAEEVDDPLLDVFSQEEILRLTGFPDTPNSSIRKLYWIKKKEPKLYAETACMLQCKDYLAYCLTGALRTDYSDAASTGALDIERGVWSDKILDALGLDMAKLPPLAHSNEVVGRVTEEAAARFGVPAGVPVVMGAGDILCSAVGAGCIHPGDMYMSLGSSSWVAFCTEKPEFGKEPVFSVCPHAVPGRFLTFVNYQTAGVVFKWLKNEIFRYGPDGRTEVLPYKNVYPYTGMEELAEKSPLGAGGLLFLPHILEGDSSHREPWAKGAYLGLGWETTREDMVRAALEGITFELRYFAEVSGQRPERLTVTGIASHERFWLQMIADVFGIPVRNTFLHDTPDSIGAAVIAGQAVGIYEDFGQADRFRSFEETFLPDRERHEQYQPLYEIYRGAFRNVEGTLGELAKWREKGGKTG